MIFSLLGSPDLWAESFTRIFAEIMPFIIIVLIVLIAFLILSSISRTPKASKSRFEEIEKERWKYGDVWRQGSPDDIVFKDETSYVEILRGDMGKGYDDSYMIDLVVYLGSKGIHATYDSFSLGIEGAAIKTYVLKVERGEEDEARRHLKEKAL